MIFGYVITHSFVLIWWLVVSCGKSSNEIKILSKKIRIEKVIIILIRFEDIYFNYHLVDLQIWFNLKIKFKIILILIIILTIKYVFEFFREVKKLWYWIKLWRFFSMNFIESKEMLWKKLFSINIITEWINIKILNWIDWKRYY